MILADGAEAQPISLVPTTPRPMGRLAQLDDLFSVSDQPSAVEITLAAAALPAPDAYPQLRVTSPPEPVRVMVDAPPPPASPKPPIVMAKADAAFPPMPDAAAQAALRNMLCNRMSAHEDAACVAPEQPEVVLASAERRYVSAEVQLAAAERVDVTFYTDTAWRAEVRSERVRYTPASRRMGTVAFMQRDRATTGPTPRIQTAQASGPAPIVFR